MGPGFQHIPLCRIHSLFLNFAPFSNYRIPANKKTKPKNSFLPENVAHSAAMTVAKSTVTAPVSLYAITFINTINPTAKRPNVPGTMTSVILQRKKFKNKKE